MRLIEIYKCLCDETRLRILHLLRISPLCACHLQAVLDKPQVIISQHLSYLRGRGMISSSRHRQWIINALPDPVPAELEMNLQCLQDCVQTEPVFQNDRERLLELMNGRDLAALLDDGCCPRPAGALRTSAL